MWFYVDKIRIQTGVKRQIHTLMHHNVDTCTVGAFTLLFDVKHVNFAKKCFAPALGVLREFDNGIFGITFLHLQITWRT